MHEVSVTTYIKKKSYTTILFIQYYGKTEETVITGRCENDTLNAIELKAVIAGLKAIASPSIITIYTKSGYIKGVLENYWYVAWSKNGWKNAKNKSAANGELWQQLIRLLKLHVFRVETKH